MPRKFLGLKKETLVLDSKGNITLICVLCPHFSLKRDLLVQVFLTDCVPSVLHNLRSCAMMNYEPSTAPLDLDDLSDASTVSDLDFGDLSIQDSHERVQWDMGNMCVRYFDWSKSTTHSYGAVENSSTAYSQTSVNKPESDWPGVNTLQDLPACLNPGEGFDVILGADVIYEAEHAGLIAAVISHRLKKCGRCLVIGAIREQVINSNSLEL